MTVEKCPYCNVPKPVDARRGKYRGERPFGLMPDPNDPNGSVKNYEEEATIITVCTRWEEGDSLRAIARWLNDEGVTNRRGGVFTHKMVKAMLVRRGYIKQDEKLKGQF